MLSMVDRQEIIHRYRVDQESIRSISRTLDISRDTVTKVVKEYLATLSSEHPDESLEDVLTLRPKYDASSREARRLTKEMTDVIQDCIKRNRIALSNGIRKQGMQKCDIHAFLVSKGFKISYSTICNYVRKQTKPPKPSEAFIRQAYKPGYGVEFDWGEVILYIRGKKTRFYIAVFTFQYSNGRYAYLFRHQNKLAFMESHRNFFRAVNGSTQEVVYDNMRVAIKEFVGYEKRPTESLLKMSDFYAYRCRFCNARAGWEKGHVERSVEVVRRKAFNTLYLRFDSIEDAQEHLTKACNALNQEEGSIATIGKQWKLSEDIGNLQPIIGDMGCFEMEKYSVDKWSTVAFNNAHYSVPDTLVGQRVKVKIYSEKLVFFSEGKKVASHERAYLSGAWKVDINHYLRTMLRKPGSVGSSEAMRQVPEEIKDIFCKYFKDCPKDFVKLLMYTNDKGFTHSDIIKAYSALQRTHTHKITADHIKSMLHYKEDMPVMVETAAACIIPDEQLKQIEDGATDMLNAVTGIMGAEQHNVINN